MSDVALLRRSMLSRWLHFAVLLQPAIALGVIAFRTELPLLIAGAVTALLVVPIMARNHLAWRPPGSGPVLLMYLAALAVLWFATRGTLDGITFAARGLLMLMIALLIASHDLYRTGAEPRRRAQKWCGRLQARRDWPSDTVDVMHLPEVYGLRGAAEVEPGPVFALFRDPRPEVRAAAFAALAGRPAWRMQPRAKAKSRPE